MIFSAKIFNLYFVITNKIFLIVLTKNPFCGPKTAKIWGKKNRFLKFFDFLSPIREMTPLFSFFKELVERVIEVVNVNEKIIVVKLEWNGRILHANSSYAPQKGWGDKCKEEFWNTLHEIVKEIPKEDKIWIGADLNGHIALCL